MQCPYCNGQNIKKAGVAGDKQRWICKDCYALKQQNPDNTEIKYYFQTPLDTDYNDLLMESSKQAKKRQRFQDINRIERKAWRSDARIHNAVAEYNKELINIFKQHRAHNPKIITHASPGTAAGIFHFTDAHFNELVNLPFNRYDFKIAAKRAQKLVDKARRVYKAFGVKKVLVAFTGDLINSDRRLDELLEKATNRSKASFLAFDILRQMLLDLNQDFNLSVASVMGNESRCHDDIHYSDIMATDNYDFTLHEMLRYNLAGQKGIYFYRIENPLEQVVCINDKNVLLIHGHQKKLANKNVLGGIERLARKYNDKGIKLDLILFGHIHEALIADLYARGGSMVGANSYSENALMLTSRASQNIHILQDTDIHSVKVDLQGYQEYDGYEIDSRLEEYNAKSLYKSREHKTVFEVVI